jgi:ABC-type polysaccharide transport system permease subunit
MPIRLRKFIGMIALVVLVIVYAFVAMVIAQLKLPDAPRYAQMIYYVVVGLAWVIPAGFIIKWMQKPEPPQA